MNQKSWSKPSSARLVACLISAFFVSQAIAQDVKPAEAKPAETKPAAAAASAFKSSSAALIVNDKLPANSVKKITLLDIASAGARLVAVGDRGYILRSTDFGASWTRVESGEKKLLTAVAFASAEKGWAVGHDSVILATTNGGESWTKQFSDEKESRPLLDVVFLDENNGIAIGAYGSAMVTSDGKTWAPKEITKSDKHLNAITKLSDGRLLVVGEEGTILISSDKGATFSAVESPYKGSYFGAVEAADKSIIIFGLRGRVYRSTDGAKSFSQINIQTDGKPLSKSVMGGGTLADGTLVLVGLQGLMMSSKDNGQSFAVTKATDNKGFSAIAQGTGNSMVVVGESGAADITLAAAK